MAKYTEINLNSEEYEILLDEFLLRDDIKMMMRHVSDNNYVRLAHKCFDVVVKDSKRDCFMYGSTTEQNLINIARAMLIGYSLGKDITSGVSRRHNKT